MIVLRRKTLVLPFLSTGLSIALSIAGPAQVQPPGSLKLYPVNQGQLKLQLPAGWVDEVQGSLSGAPFAMTLRPAQGNRFLIRWAVSWDEKAGTGFNAPGRLQEIVMAAGSQLLPHAAEKQLSLREIKGPSARGCYVPLTVKAPQAGDYEMMAQGAAALGDLLIVFTYRGHTGGEVDFSNLMEVIRGAALVETQPRR